MPAPTAGPHARTLARGRISAGRSTEKRPRACATRQCPRTARRALACPAQQPGSCRGAEGEHERGLQGTPARRVRGGRQSGSPLRSRGLPTPAPRRICAPRRPGRRLAHKREPRSGVTRLHGLPQNPGKSHRRPARSTPRPGPARQSRAPWMAHGAGRSGAPRTRTPQACRLLPHGRQGHEAQAAQPENASLNRERDRTATCWWIAGGKIAAAGMPRSRRKNPRAARPTFLSCAAKPGHEHTCASRPQDLKRAQGLLPDSVTADPCDLTKAFLARVF